MGGVFSVGPGLDAAAIPRITPLKVDVAQIQCASSKPLVPRFGRWSEILLYSPPPRSPSTPIRPTRTAQQRSGDVRAVEENAFITDDIEEDGEDARDGDPYGGEADVVVEMRVREGAENVDLAEEEVDEVDEEAFTSGTSCREDASLVDDSGAGQAGAQASASNGSTGDVRGLTSEGLEGGRLEHSRDSPAIAGGGIGEDRWAPTERSEGTPAGGGQRDSTEDALGGSDRASDSGNEMLDDGSEGGAGAAEGGTGMSEATLRDMEAIHCRGLVCSAAVGDAIYFFGGEDSFVRVVDIVKRTCEVLYYARGTPPRPKTFATAVAIPPYMYVFGGLAEGATRGDFHRFDTVNHTWEEVSIDGAPYERMGAVAASIGTCIYAFGGFRGQSRLHMIDTAEENPHWIRLEPEGTGPGMPFGVEMCAFRDRLYLFGGTANWMRGAVGGSCGKLFIYSTATNMWICPKLKGTLPSPRTGHQLVPVGECIWIFGGLSAIDYMNDLYVYEPDSRTIKEVTTRGPRPHKRSRCTAASVNGHLVILGGEYSDHMILDCHALLPDSREQLNDPVSVPQSTLGEDLGKLLESGAGSDVRILVGKHGRVLCAHSVILAARCEYFRSALSGNMMTEKMDGSLVVRIQDVGYESMREVLSYLYTDKLETTPQSACHTLALADRFCLPRLRSLAAKYLSSHLTTENAAAVLKVALEVNAKELEEECVSMLSVSFSSRNPQVARWPVEVRHALEKRMMIMIDPT